METTTTFDVTPLNKAILDGVTKKIGAKFPRRSIWASQLGHPCLRYNEYGITRWKDALPHDVGLQQIFDEGKLHEEALDQQLKEAGFLVRLAQQPLDEVVTRDGKRMKYNISGRLDREISHPELLPNIWLPLEFKTMASHIYQSIDTLDDMVNHRHWYIRTYPTQLNFYLYAKSKELGLFLLKDKGTGAKKFVPCPLDYNLGERMLRNAEDINLAVERIEADPENAESYLSPRIPFDEKICGRCPFNHICLPDAQFGGVEIDLDEETELKLRKREELKQAVAEYKELDESVKDIFKKRPEGKYLVGGSFNVIVKEVPESQRSFTIPKHKEARITALKTEKKRAEVEA